jgi:phage tail sheath protein FI
VGETGTTAFGLDDTLDTGDYIDAAAVFEDAETIDVNLLFTAGIAANGTTGYSPGESKLLEIANTRKDCVVFISAPLGVSTATSDSSRLSAVNAKFKTGSVTRSSYAVWDSTPVYVYNKYADKYVWIPACGHMAGLCANTDNVAEPWFSPAGYNRGNLLGVTKLAFNPKQADRDELYKLGVNPIVAFPGQGILLFGDKTAQAKPSAFDRINVRRLFITLEKAISTAAKYQLFELNDEFTRAMFRNMVEPFLRDVKGRRGVTDFLVICDETNNTGEVIDSNRFVADIYIKPARSINFITLNFIATRTGVEFSEIVGK